MRKWTLLVALLFSQGAHAGFETGNKLLTKCESELGIEEFYCIGYIIGIADMHDADVVWGNREKSWCLPTKVLISQLKGAVLKYLKDNPNKLHFDASSRVAHAFIKAFPCEQPSQD